MESEKREAKLKAEKEALSRACEREESDLGDAWAAAETAAGLPGEGGAGAEHGSASNSQAGQLKAEAV